MSQTAAGSGNWHLFFSIFLLLSGLRAGRDVLRKRRFRVFGYRHSLLTYRQYSQFMIGDRRGGRPRIAVPVKGDSCLGYGSGRLNSGGFVCQDGQTKAIVVLRLRGTDFGLCLLQLCLT